MTLSDGLGGIGAGVVFLQHVESVTTLSDGLAGDGAGVVFLSLYPLRISLSRRSIIQPSSSVLEDSAGFDEAVGNNKNNNYLKTLLFSHLQLLILFRGHIKMPIS